MVWIFKTLRPLAPVTLHHPRASSVSLGGPSHFLFPVRFIARYTRTSPTLRDPGSYTFLMPLPQEDARFGRALARIDQTKRRSRRVSTTKANQRMMMDDERQRIVRVPSCRPPPTSHHQPNLHAPPPPRQFEREQVANAIQGEPPARSESLNPRGATNFLLRAPSVFAVAAVPDNVRISRTDRMHGFASQYMRAHITTLNSSPPPP